MKLFLASHLAAFFVKEDGTLVKRKNGVDTIQPVSPDGDGYLKCNLCIAPGKMKVFKVHLLVAEHYIENPRCLPEVNHKDGVKANCAASNLEWSNRRGQMLHAYSTGLHRPKSSRFHGVSRWQYRPHTKVRWRAQIEIDAKCKLIGSFDEEEQAALAYNAFVTEQKIDVPLNIL